MLGHNGGIDGFVSSFAYSTSRDVGYVVLLNSTHSGDAMRRISQLAVRYLKADVDPPAKMEAEVPEAVLRELRGLLPPGQPAQPGVRVHRVAASAAKPSAVNGKHLQATSGIWPRRRLVPVANNLFRLEADPEPTRVFATDDSGTMVLTGGMLYAERKPRWRVESVRWPVLVSAALVAHAAADDDSVDRSRASRRAGGLLVAEAVAALLQHRTPAAGDWRDERRRRATGNAQRLDRGDLRGIDPAPGRRDPVVPVHRSTPS